MKLLSILSLVFFYICSNSYAYEMPNTISLKGLSVSHTSFDFNTDVDGRFRGAAPRGAFRGVRSGAAGARLSRSSR